MYLREIGLYGAKWIRLAQDWGPMASFFEYGNEP